MHEATERLLELGLSDKEALVYLAMLELGPSCAQDISQKAGVNRSTVYVLLDVLKQRGLASSAQREDRTVFLAESPKRLEDLILQKKMEIEHKQRKLEDSIPYFMALFNAVQDKPQVRFFEGEKGIASAREVLMQTEGEFLSFTAIDEATERMSKIHEDQRLRMARRTRGRFIYSLKPGCVRPIADLRSWQAREISFEAFPFTGEINIVSDKVAAYVVKQKPISFLVESKEMSDLFRAMFEAAWMMAKPAK